MKSGARKKPLLRFDVVTLFPSMFEGPMSESLIGRARETGLIELNFHQLRRWSDDRHDKVDDRSFGGGPGMVIKAEPVYRAVTALGGRRRSKARPWIVYLSPQGKVLTQALAGELRRKKHLILLCGHYEGIDERAMEWVDEEISIGDYVLTGGEIPAMVVIDAVSRLVPGVVGDAESIKQDSFIDGILDFPHYTRPSVWRGRKVPPVLLSGHHRMIEQWRRAQALKQTRKKKPNLKTFPIFER